MFLKADNFFVAGQEKYWHDLLAMDILAIFDKLKGSPLPITICFNGEKEIVKIDLTVQDVDRSSQTLLFNVGLDHLPKIQEIVESKGVALFIISKQRITFRSRVLALLNNVLQVEAPAQLERVERRKEKRIKKEIAVSISDGKERDDGKIVDLGVDGCSVIKNRSLCNLKKGKKYSISFFDEELSFILDAKLLNVIDIKKEEKTVGPTQQRLSFQFVELDISYKTVLDIFIKKYDPER